MNEPLQFAIFLTIVALIFLGIPTLAVWLIVSGIHTGSIRTKYGRVKLKESPKTFWSVVSFYALGGLFFLGLPLYAYIKIARVG